MFAQKSSVPESEFARINLGKTLLKLKRVTVAKEAAPFFKLTFIFLQIQQLN